MRETDVEALAAAQRAGAVVIDVREPEEYVAGHVPGARLVPLDELAARSAELSRGDPLYVICASGNRSQRAVSWLAGQGFDAVSVAGGTQAWQRSGRPVVAEEREDS